MTTYEQTILSTMIETLQIIRKFTGSNEMPMQMVLTFLHIARRGETLMADLEKPSGVAQSAVSRNVAKLGIGLSPSEPGMGLLEAYEDPHMRRRKLVRLTPRGRMLVKELSTGISPKLKRWMEGEDSKK